MKCNLFLLLQTYKNIFSFDLTIINEQANFLILFNGKKFCKFVHRSQNLDIETLEVDGTFELHTVTINNAR